MKILHLIYDDIDNPWVGGGGALRVYEICRRLAKKHDITVITGKYPGSCSCEKSGVLYKRIGIPKSYFLSRLTYGLNAWRYIIGKDYDLIVDEFSAHSPCFTPFFTRKPVIASLQNLYAVHALKSHRLLGLLFILFEKCGLRLYKNFIPGSPFLKNKLENEILKDERIKAEVIPNGVEEFLFSGRVTEKNYILFLGRIDIYHKGLDILLTAFENIADKIKNLDLLIAGGGRDEKRLKNLIAKSNVKERIKFIGRVYEREEKRKLLSEALFVCTPSRFETWPLVPIEAGACGKAVIATKIPGNWDAVKEGETGVLIKPDDAGSLFKAMLRLLEDVNLRKKLGGNAEQWARKFLWGEIAKKQENFYYRCLDGT
jgi:glycogen(starch) synthase